MKKSTLSDWQEYYREKADEAFEEYQDSGATRYYNAWKKYELHADAFASLTRERESSGDEEISKKIEKLQGFVERKVYSKDHFTRSEVENLLSEAIRL